MIKESHSRLVDGRKSISFFLVPVGKDDITSSYLAQVTEPSCFSLHGRPSGDNAHTVNPAGAIWSIHTHKDTRHLSQLECVCSVLLVRSGLPCTASRQ